VLQFSLIKGLLVSLKMNRTKSCFVAYQCGLNFLLLPSYYLGYLVLISLL
jgi:hypothetical protein